MAQRKKRADAVHNRERIVAAATDAIAEDGPSVSLERIARLAEVGPGTLYRHFPTRDELLAAVFAGRISALCDQARRFSERHDPREALHRWVVTMLDHTMTDNGLLEALALSGSKPEIDCSARVLEAASSLLDHAQDAGTTRSDLTPDDLLRLVIGLGRATDDRSQARRLLNVMLDGTIVA